MFKEMGKGMAKIVCDNCGEELPSFDPLEAHTWCPVCKKYAKQLSECARTELSTYGDMRRTKRENGDN
jgi:uncharacterized Zn finger protein (UPF0148 family)